MGNGRAPGRAAIRRLDKNAVNFIEGEILVELFVELNGADGFVACDTCGDF